MADVLRYGTAGLYLPDVLLPDAPRMHNHLEWFSAQLGRAPTSALWIGALEPLLESIRCPFDRLVPDHRGVYIWDLANGSGSLERAVDWAFSVLGIRRHLGGEDFRQGMVDFLEGFYGPRAFDGILGVAMVESCRDRILNRFRSATNGGPKIRQAANPAAQMDFGEQPLVEAPGISLTTQRFAYCAKRLKFLTPEDLAPADAVLTQNGFLREVQIAGGDSDFGFWTSYFAANRDAHEGIVKTGAYPIRVRSFIGEDVNPGRLVNWIALRPTTGRIEYFAFDIDVEREGILTVRHAKTSLQLLTEMDPRMDRWLYTALHGRDFFEHG